MEGLFVKRSRPLTIGVPRLGTGTEDQALSGVIVRCLIMHGCTLGRVSVAAHARRSEIATLRVLAGHGSSGNPELPADPVAPARFRVLATPGLADGFAADDIVELATLGNARVLKRGGNLGFRSTRGPTTTNVLEPCHHPPATAQRLAFARRPVEVGMQERP